MRAAVTGGAGFIGRSLVRQLRGRGDAVVAIVRDPARAGALLELGCELVDGDLAAMPAEVLRAGLEGADALFHLAGSYRVGIPAAEHAAMHRANVAATRAVLDAATAAGVARMSRCRPSTCTATPTAGWSTRRIGGRSRPTSCPTTMRRSTSPTWRPRRGSAPALRS